MYVNLRESACMGQTRLIVLVKYDLERIYTRVSVNARANTCRVNIHTRVYIRVKTLGVLSRETAFGY